MNLKPVVPAAPIGFADEAFLYFYPTTYHSTPPDMFSHTDQPPFHPVYRSPFVGSQTVDYTEWACAAYRGKFLPPQEYGITNFKWEHITRCILPLLISPDGPHIFFGDTFEAIIKRIEASGGRVFTLRLTDAEAMKNG